MNVSVHLVKDNEVCIKTKCPILIGDDPGVFQGVFLHSSLVVKFLGKTIITQVHKRVPANFMLEETLSWNSIPSRGSKKIPNLFVLWKPEIHAGLMQGVTKRLPIAQD